MKPKLAVLDLDDTLVSFTSFLCDLKNKLDGSCIHESDVNDWELMGVNFEDARGGGVKGRELFKLYKEYEDFGLYSRLPVLPGVQNAVEFISFLGYKICILTARPEKFRKETELFLLMEDLKYDILMFNEDKVSSINELEKKYRIAMFIDDKFSTIKDVRKNCNVKNVFLVNKAHNQSVELPEGVVRVGGLFECIKFLKKVR